jgi:hypothetical protein
MPDDYVDDRLVFKEGSSETANWSLKLDAEMCQMGPEISYRWKNLNEQWHLSVSLRLGERNASFVVPLLLPAEKETRKRFFILLSRFIDEFGQEVLSEKNIEILAKAKIDMLVPSEVSPVDPYGVHVISGEYKKGPQTSETTSENYCLGKNETPEGVIDLLPGDYRIGKTRALVICQPDTTKFQIQYCYDRSETRMWQESEVIAYRFSTQGLIHHIKYLKRKRAADLKVIRERLFYHIPDELTMRGSNLDAFEPLVKCSPLLKQVWQDIAPTSEREKNEIRVSLHTFIAQNSYSIFNPYCKPNPFEAARQFV